MKKQTFLAIDLKFREYLELVNLYLSLNMGHLRVFNDFGHVGWSFNHIMAESSISPLQIHTIDRWATNMHRGLIDGFRCYLNEFPDPSTTNHKTYHQRGYVNKLAKCILSGMLEIHTTTDLSENKVLDWGFFNRYVGTAIRRILEYRNDIWMRHGFEDYDFLPKYTEGDFTGKLYPTYYKECPQTNWWAIEIGDLPFRSNMLCWTWPLGFLPLRVFYHIAPTGKVAPCKFHFAASAKTPLSEWVFLVRDEDNDNNWNPLSCSYGVLSLASMNLLIEVRDRIVNALRVICTEPIRKQILL